MTAGAGPNNGAGVKTDCDLTPCGMDTCRAKEKPERKGPIYFVFFFSGGIFSSERGPLGATPLCRELGPGL